MTSEEENESDDVEGKLRCHGGGTAFGYYVCLDDERCGPDVWDLEDERCGPDLFEDDGVEGYDLECASDEDEDLDMDGDNEDELGTSDAPSPLKKRTKTSHSVAASPSESMPSLMPTMPLDILFEIISWLSPKDIVSLSRTSKILHEILSSRNALTVWKASRERVSIPDGPDWMREVAWADLLFGHTCQSCGISKTKSVDFLLLKRICVSCKKRNYILRSKVKDHFQNFDLAILDLVPSTNISAWYSFPRSSYYYCDFDIRSMVHKLAALKKGADAQQLNNFMEERKRRLQCLRQNLSSWQKLYEQLQRDRAQEKSKAEERRLQQIKEKFIELGYVEEDLRGLHSRKECRGTVQLSTKLWNRIRPILEPEVEEQQSQRLERQLVEVKRGRIQVLAARYKVFRRTVDPPQWKYLPRTLELAAVEGFSQHIEADAGMDVDGTMFDNTFLEFPNLLAAATEQRKASLCMLMVGITRDLTTDPIHLATAVFKCVEVGISLHFSYVFGWDEIASHHCLPEMEWRNSSALRTTPSELQYSPEVASVVRKLAEITGLDAATATANDLDEKNKRFSCVACSRRKRRGYTWRNMAGHLEMWKTHNPGLKIKVLSDNEENEIKQCERNDSKWNKNQWTCARCPEYMDNLQDRPSIIAHLSDSHGIPTASEPTDYFFFERYRENLSTKPKFSVPAPEVRALEHQVVVDNLQKPVFGKFRCLVCVRKRNREFYFKGLEDHLRAVHNISSGQNGVCYAPV